MHMLHRLSRFDQSRNPQEPVRRASADAGSLPG
jgi:hypothetical protein